MYADAIVDLCLHIVYNSTPTNVWRKLKKKHVEFNNFAKSNDSTTYCWIIVAAAVGCCMVVVLVVAFVYRGS